MQKYRIVYGSSFIFKSMFIGNVSIDGTVNVEISVQLNYLSNFRRTLEMQLMNCEMTLDLI